MYFFTPPELLAKKQAVVDLQFISANKKEGQNLLLFYGLSLTS